MAAVGAITDCECLSHSDNYLSSTLKIDLNPLFPDIIHRQYYTSCIIAQSAPLTLLSPLSI